jgi:hypothetical protein
MLARMSSHAVDRRLARRAARQHGLITRAQALEAGCTQTMISDRVTAGRWVAVASGVFRVNGAPVTFQQSAHAACLDAGRPAGVSHRSAAVLLGASGLRPGRVEILVPVGFDSRCTIATVHRTRVLDRADLTAIDRIPVTTPARTLVDLAGVVPSVVLEEVVDDFLCRKLVSLSRVRRRARELGGRGRVGMASLRTILDAWVDGPVPGSTAEMRVVRCLLRHGLPQPRRQFAISHNGTFVARVDLAYPEAKIVIELDSFRWHGPPSVRQ